MSREGVGEAGKKRGSYAKEPLSTVAAGLRRRQNEGEERVRKGYQPFRLSVPVGEGPAEIRCFSREERRTQGDGGQRRRYFPADGEG